ncbi:MULTISPECIES: DUF4391 domain-containing protein [Pseudomonas]|uniref:DUF4391 domain-containing protein n=1 Tax=Pseudomonas TaxID=286 RepID=UPI000F7AB2D7|nr:MULTISPECIES: DUF4391 domain-containing protein [Pseudomonas]MBW5416222.1 DUF4391 family protein [Pseudomonas sp. MAG002Y]RRW40714.1 DUF4391 domain-containing protein [Pseudomonas luteola]
MSAFPVRHPAFINYPKQASFGRVLPKNKVYEHSGASTRLKNLFVEQVEQIVWQYKLAPETINLPARAAVPEVQVFRIVLKTQDLSVDVLKCIDGVVQFPVIFELEYEGKTKIIAAHKRPNEADASKWVFSNYFSTLWMPSDSERDHMPVALDMAGLYEALLQRLIPLAPRAEERFTALVERLENVKAKQREIEKVRAKLAKEKQFNRKVEINGTLRQLNNELEELSH